MMIMKLSRARTAVCLAVALVSAFLVLARAQPTGQVAGPTVVSARSEVNLAGSQVPQPAQGPAAVRPAVGASSASQALQAHLSAIQAQAQRQLGQLNGLMINSASQLVASATPLAAQAVNLTGQASNKYGSVIEAIANVGKAIQQQIIQSNNNPNAVQIVTSSSTGGLASGLDSAAGNNKKNEYQSIVVSETQPLVVGAGANPSQQQQVASSGQNPGAPATNVTANNYREQGELLRQEIVRRAGQLQQVIANSMDVLKNNGDLIVRRLLEQLNHRLDQAKSKADKIINEPATNEMALKALGTINLGLNNLNNIISNIVSRIDLSAKDEHSDGTPQRAGGLLVSPLIDTNKLRQTVQQLGQQFHSALNSANQQPRPWQLPQQQANGIPPFSVAQRTARSN